MSAKYSRLPTTDPDSVSLNFDTIHKYGSQTQEFGQAYGGYATHEDVYSSKSQFKSAFTYSGGFDPRKPVGIIDDTPPSLASKVCSQIVTVLSFILLGLTFPISAWFSFKNVQTYERLVIFRLGKLIAAKGPGTVLVIPIIDRSSKIDLRMRSFCIPPQKVLTLDGATIEVGAEVYYRVKDAVQSVSNVQDLNHSTRVISETTLQKHLAKYELNDIHGNKTTIAHALVMDINQMTLTWGTEVTRADLSQVKVLAEANPSLLGGGAAADPMKLLGPLLFPGGAPPPSSGGDAELSMPTDPNSMDAGIMGKLQQEQLATLQKQHPHLSKELVYLMQQQGARQGDMDAAVGAAGGMSIAGPRDMLDRVVPRLSPDLVQRFMCVYKFIVTGAGGGTFFLDLKHGHGLGGEGEPPRGEADVTVTLDTSTLGQLLTGQLHAFSAYMTGQISVQGDMSKASQIADLIDLIK